MHGSEASVGVADLGLQRGYAVFDYVRTYNGKLFHFHEHFERLRKSSSALHLALPYAEDETSAIAEQLISESDLKNPAVRLILTGGYAYGSVAIDRPNFIMTAENLPSYPGDLYTHGGKIITFEYQRELPRVKTINYMNAIRLEPLKQQKSAFDILYYYRNRVTECPRNNFFIFHGDTLITPKDNILLGITRKLILRLAQEHFGVEGTNVTFTGTWLRQ